MVCLSSLCLSSLCFLRPVGERVGLPLWGRQEASQPSPGKIILADDPIYCVSPHRIQVLQLLAVLLSAKILIEKWHHMILETVGHLAGMRALVHFEAVCDSISV